MGDGGLNPGKPVPPAEKGAPEQALGTCSKAPGTQPVLSGHNDFRHLYGIRRGALPPGSRGAAFGGYRRHQTVSSSRYFWKPSRSRIRREARPIIKSVSAVMCATSGWARAQQQMASTASVM